MNDKNRLVELDDLVNRIVSTYNMTIYEISEAVGYNKTYISQCKSRNKVSNVFLYKLKSKFPEAGKAARPDNDLESTVSVLMERVAFLLSQLPGRSSAQIEREMIIKDAATLRKIRSS